MGDKDPYEHVHRKLQRCDQSISTKSNISSTKYRETTSSIIIADTLANSAMIQVDKNCFKTNEEVYENNSYLTNTNNQIHPNENGHTPYKSDIDGASDTNVFGCGQKTKAHRVPSTPTLIVSDTSTGLDNCVLESTVLPNYVFKEKVRESCSTFDSKQSSLDETDYSISTENMTESEANSPTEIQSVESHILLSPRRSCDSAYGSCMETALSIPQDEVSPASSITDNDIIMENVCSGNPAFSSSEDSPNHSSYGASLSVSLPCTSTSTFSSNSSIASDLATEAPCGVGEDPTSSGCLRIDKESLNIRKLSSSSTFSLRSTLSLEESEEDFASGDDTLSSATTARRHRKIKAQNSWTKIRRMVIWSPFMQSFKKKYPWVQLAGHAGNFQPGEEGCILKKYVEREAECLKGISAEPLLREFAPNYHGVVQQDGEMYTRMQDLLMPFESPSLMDCKMGIRTYLEDELIKAKEKPCLRHDMYQKMIEISPDEPTVEENAQEAVTKPRYMQWREQVSSTSNLGFRIEGIKKSNKDPSKDYKLTKTAEQVTAAFNYFIDCNILVLKKYIERLKSMRNALDACDFFHCHEAIGSSLLFVHDDTGMANIWMIDFGKTCRLPEGNKLDHRRGWVEGNREDGYLFGMDNMIKLFEDILKKLNTEATSVETPSSQVNCVQNNHSPPSQRQIKVSRVSITLAAPPVRKPATKRQIIKRRVAQVRQTDVCALQRTDVTNGDFTEVNHIERTS